MKGGGKKREERRKRRALGPPISLYVTYYDYGQWLLDLVDDDDDVLIFNCYGLYIVRVCVVRREEGELVSFQTTLVASSPHLY